MRGIDELDYYELLEIPRTATVEEVGRAYRQSQQIYGEGSLALYSVFESHDAAAIRERLDEAYRVLSDPELRAQYDQSHSFQAEDATQTAVLPGSMSESAGVSLSNGDAGPASSELRDTLVVSDEGQEYDVFEDDGGGDFDGLRLRRTRLFRGYEIDDISDVTKVSGSHLRNIEEENFVDLPADVYVRGFVGAYASTIGLDPKVVVPSYMARVEASRTANQRGRFLGRQ
jgi:DnaJ-class molecular chaperone